jgi:hypothetical protein
MLHICSYDIVVHSSVNFLHGMERQIVEVMSCYAKESIVHVHIIVGLNICWFSTSCFKFRSQSIQVIDRFMLVQAQLCDIPLVTNTVDIESMVPKSNRSRNGGYRIQTSKGGRGRCNRYIICANSVAVDFTILRLVLLVLSPTVLGFILQWAFA